MTDIQIVRPGGFRNQAVAAGEVFGVESIRAGDVGQTGILTGPVLIPPAPSFPGMDFVQVIPANLFLSGALALDEPIGSLPLYGNLISGAFTASDSDRPILKNVEGRIGAYHDGTRLLELAGINVTATSGHLFFCVKKDESTGNYQGFARFQKNVTPDTTTNSTFEFYNAGSGQYVVTNRFEANNVAGTTQRPRNSFFVLGANLPDDEYLNRGVYVDGVKNNSLGSIAPRMSSAFTAIQIAGYNQTRAWGNLETWGIYNGTPNGDQRDELRDYLRLYFNSGEPFEEPEP